MRLHHLALLSFLAACNITPPGKLGQPCGNWVACEGGLRCIDDTCVACGAPGQVCCTEGTGLGCNDNVACVDADWDNPGTCSGECGSVGLACCGNDNPCPNGGECNLGKCTDAVGDACQSGKDAYTFIAIEADCFEQTVTFKTDTPEEADLCAQKFAAQAAGREVCASPTTSTVCKQSVNGLDTLYFDHCSDAQLQQCEQLMCGVDCSWSDGACPAP